MFGWLSAKYSTQSVLFQLGRLGRGVGVVYGVKDTWVSKTGGHTLIDETDRSKKGMNEVVVSVYRSID